VMGQEVRRRACRGREMRLVFSSLISFHCVIQPTERATANSTVNMLTGMPNARSTMPEKKSTCGVQVMRRFPDDFRQLQEAIVGIQFWELHVVFPAMMSLFVPC